MESYKEPSGPSAQERALMRTLATILETSEDAVEQRGDKLFFPSSEKDKASLTASLHEIGIYPGEEGGQLFVHKTEDKAKLATLGIVGIDMDS